MGNIFPFPSSTNLQRSAAILSSCTSFTGSFIIFRLFYSLHTSLVYGIKLKVNSPLSYQKEDSRPLFLYIL